MLYYTLLMDEHKHFRKPKRPSVSLDGMVGSGRQLGVPVNRSYRPSPSAPSDRLADSYRRPDGFHASNNSQHNGDETPEAAETLALLEEPIILDDDDDKGSKKSKKKHYFGSKQSRLKKVLKRGALALLILLLLGAGYFGLKIYNTDRKSTRLNSSHS